LPDVLPTLTADPIHTEIAQLVQQVNTMPGQLATTNAAGFSALSTAQAADLADLNARIDNLMTNQAAIVVAQGATLESGVTTATPSRTPRPTRTPTPTWTPSITPTITPTALPNQVLFRIVPEESEVHFTVLEDAGPDPGRLTIVGRTNQVAGDIIVDFDDPRNSRLGTVRVNIRSLRTQYPGQGEAMRGTILLSERPEFEFSDFVPTALTGLPDNITIGQPVEFQITGDFPLRGVTRSLTFEATVTPVSETELHGYATTTIMRQDYGLMQGALTGHLVHEEIKLEIEFIARAVN
jgi:polyisoprenoid-binding protein YceI